GNQEIACYQSLAVLGVTSYPIGGNNVIGYSPFQISNPDLKWETTNQFDVGIDAAFFKNRIQLTADYYYKRTHDLLLYVNLPISSGFPTALKNIGSVQNQGVELYVSTKNLVGAFTWSTDFNIAFNRNKLLSLAGEDAIPIASRVNQLDPGWLVVGMPIGLFYGLRTDGLWQEGDDFANSAQPNARPGDIKYVDFNNDSVINMNDRQLIGRSEPKFFGGISNIFRFKGFELIVFLQGVYGNDIWNGNLLSHEYPNGLYNQYTTVLDRWTPENPDGKVPRASAFMQDAFEMDRFVEDGSYLRLKTVTLSYDLTNLIRMRNVQSCRIFFTGENLATLTNYSGYDPEVNYFGKNYLAAGYDWGAYPSVKSYIFGFKLTF
ncbi:MAG: TonB-dependent receptor, partial [Bacteroidales bacterium]